MSRKWNVALLKLTRKIVYHVELQLDNAWWDHQLMGETAPKLKTVYDDDDDDGSTLFLGMDDGGSVMMEEPNDGRLLTAKLKLFLTCLHKNEFMIDRK